MSDVTRENQPQAQALEPTGEGWNEQLVRAQNPDAIRETDTLLSAELRLTDADLAVYREQSLSVLRLLEQLYPPEEALPFAGMSLSPEAHSTQEHYRAGFGRDTLTALDLLLDNANPGQAQPTVARALVRLAEIQGTTVNPVNEELPGKIVHEYRAPTDPRRLELEAQGWQFPYYGSVDATPQFVLVASRYLLDFEPERASQVVTSELNGATQTLGQAVELAADLVTTQLADSDTGLLEFYNPQSYGNKAQNWTDSPQAFHHLDGSLANFEAPIAALEVQALTYDALRIASQLLPNRAEEYEPAAAKLRQATLALFWDAGTERLAMGVDRDPSTGAPRAIQTRRSAIGRLLDSDLLTPTPEDTAETKAELNTVRTAVVAQLFAPDMLAPYGIRTLSTESPWYRPTQYHNGCIWAYDSALIARGLERHGYFGLARELNTRVYSAIDQLGFLPEFYNSSPATTPQINRWDIQVRQTDSAEVHAAAPPKEVQLWTAAAIARIKYTHGHDALPGARRQPLPRLATDEAKRAFEAQLLERLSR